MPYATTDQLLERLGSDLAALLADEDGDAAPDAAILLAALEDATAQIDAALSRRYAVPFDPPPERLVRLAVDLAVRQLYARRREAMSAEAERAYTLAVAELRALAGGSAELAGASPRVAPLAAESTTRHQAKKFDRDSLEPF
jgi:phage gp36-like protein